MGRQGLSQSSTECSDVVGLRIIGIEPSSDENTHLVYLPRALTIIFDSISVNTVYQLTMRSDALAPWLLVSLSQPATVTTKQ